MIKSEEIDYEDFMAKVVMSIMIKCEENEICM
jgi:hypothetical protein